MQDVSGFIRQSVSLFMDDPPALGRVNQDKSFAKLRLIIGEIFDLDCRRRQKTVAVRHVPGLQPRK